MSLVLALGVGAATSLTLAELIALVPAGYVVPGYVALVLDEPPRLIAILAIALLTLGLVRLSEGRMILYGRRRLVLFLLAGMALALGHAQLTGYIFEPISAVGFIVPGLMAQWMDRQGVMITLSMTITAGVITRLLLVVITGV
jgi:gamma-polyglutamate biosynthesis protein CapC